MILCQIDSTHAITVDLQESMINSQVIKQPLKLNCLLHSLRHDYSGFIVDNATVNCRIERQLTSAWDNVNTYLVINQRLSKSPA